MGNIKVALVTIRKENAKLQMAIDDFKSYDEKYIENIISSMEIMHSDYINKLKRTLNNMADTDASKLVKHAKAYSEAIKESVDAFDKGDRETAKMFEK